MARNDISGRMRKTVCRRCLTPVAEVAKAANVGRLVLVHINPLLQSDDELDLTKARQIFLKTEIGVDGMELEF